MCRLFGFRSVLVSKVHSSLVSAENALVQQSNRHPDGWGVAYYVSGAPHIIRSVQTAVHDQLFARVSGIVSSQTVVAHLRKATQGGMSVLETHPFQFGSWVFAHNGNITDFPKHRQVLLSAVDDHLRPFILGETDSELIFFLLLTALSRRELLESEAVSVAALTDCIREVSGIVSGLTGGICSDDGASPEETFLTLLISNGSMLVGYQGGKNLYYSTHKKSCPDRDTCPSFHASCEAPTASGQVVRHLLFSSEPMEGPNEWRSMPFDSVVGVDSSFRVSFA